MLYGITRQTKDVLRDKKKKKKSVLKRMMKAPAEVHWISYWDQGKCAIKLQSSDCSIFLTLLERMIGF